MRVSRITAFATAAVVVGIASGERGQAQRAPARSGVVSIENVRPGTSVAGATAAAAAQATYWTADRLATAKPLTVKAGAATLEEPVNAAAAGQALFGEGSKPISGVPANLGEQLYDKNTVARELDEDLAGPAPFDFGTFNAQYTSSRLVPTTANTTYPYRTVGQLFFTIPGRGDFVCSASVLRPRVLLTAGHCVHEGVGGARGWHTNFLFVPAIKNGVAPYGKWGWAMAATTATWFNGGGTVPNAADYAMIELADHAGGVRLGPITGWLGWQTVSLNPNHTTQLGYPCNLDNCQQMHRVDSQAFRNVAPNNVEYGSDARGGSSGGPWIQNFGTAAAGEVGGSNPGYDRVVGVTSYGYISTGPRVQGASVFDSRFVSLLNLVCGHRAGNCS